MLDSDPSPKNASNSITECPACEEKFRLNARPRMMQLVNCPACGMTLRVVSVSPIELDWLDGEDPSVFVEKQQSRRDSRNRKSTRRDQDRVYAFEDDDRGALSYHKAKKSKRPRR